MAAPEDRTLWRDRGSKRSRSKDEPFEQRSASRRGPLQQTRRGARHPRGATASERASRRRRSSVPMQQTVQHRTRRAGAERRGERPRRQALERHGHETRLAMGAACSTRCSPPSQLDSYVGGRRSEAWSEQKSGDLASELSDGNGESRQARARRCWPSFLSSLDFINWTDDGFTPKQWPQGAATKAKHQRFRDLWRCDRRWRQRSSRPRLSRESQLELVAGWASRSRHGERVRCTSPRASDQSIGVNRANSGYRRQNGGFGAQRFSLPGGRFEVTQ